MPLDFYHGHGSPYGWRVFLALEHLEIPYHLKVVSFSDKDHLKPEFLAINPRHRVPTIVDDGFALWESTVILEYLDERFPGADGSRRLYPGDAKARALVRRRAREAEEYVGKDGIDPIVTEHFFKGAEPPDAARVAKAKERLAEELGAYEGVLAGEYLFGAAPTAADFVFYPFIAYVKRLTSRKPELALTAFLGPKLAAWASRMESAPYFDKTYPPHWRS